MAYVPGELGVRQIRGECIRVAKSDVNNCSIISYAHVLPLSSAPSRASPKSSAISWNSRVGRSRKPILERSHKGPKNERRKSCSSKTLWNHKKKEHWGLRREVPSLQSSSPLKDRCARARRGTKISPGASSRMSCSRLLPDL